MHLPSVLFNIDVMKHGQIRLDHQARCMSVMAVGEVMTREDFDSLRRSAWRSLGDRLSLTDRLHLRLCSQTDCLTENLSTQALFPSVLMSVVFCSSSCCFFCA